MILKRVNHGDLPQDVAFADLDRIEAHLAEYFDEPSLIHHERKSSKVHVDVAIVPPSPTFDHYLLVTAGLSALPMSLPHDHPDRFEWERAELCIALPSWWQMDPTSLHDEEWWWPFRFLRFWARQPHVVPGQWIGPWHSFGNGEPPEPYTKESTLVGAVILPAVFFGKAFEGFATIAGEPTIHLLQVVPVTETELAFARSSSIRELAKRLASALPPPLGISDPMRPSIV